MGTEALTEPLRETLAQFDESGEPRTTTEVAEALDLGRRSTYNRLERLAEHGRIETKKVGANARVWWRPPAAAAGTDPDWPATAESLVDDVLDDVEVGIFVLDEDFEVAWTNETIERYFGLGRERAIGRDKRRLIDERIAAVVDDSEAFAETVLATYDDNTDAERFECRVTPSEDREGRWLEHRSKPIESGAYAGGRVELYYDVTDRKRVQVARHEDREELESVVDAVDEYAIFRLDADGHVRTWNAGAAQIEGYAEDEIVGEHLSTFYTEADREGGTVEANLTAAAEQGSIEREGWRVRADGSRFWANVSLSAVYDDGTLQGYVKVARDMTDRRRAEAERELLYETTRSIAEAETFEDGLRAALDDVCETTDWEYAEAWMPTDDGKLRRAEVDYRVDDMAEFAELSEGYAFESGEGLPGRVYASGEVEWAADLAAEAEGPFLRLDEGLDAELKSALGVPVVADGEVVAVLTFLMRRRQEAAKRLVDLVSSVAAELGALIARRRAQEDLKQERELVGRIFETAPVGISIFSSDRTLERANERMGELMGLAADEANEYTAGDLSLRSADGEPLAFEERPVGRVFDAGVSVFDREVKVARADGTDRWLSVNATPLTGEDSEVTRVIATATDVTHRKEQAARLERRRAELESELDDVFDRIDDAFYALDDEMRFEYVNERAVELLGYPEGELLGRTVWDALDVAPDDSIRDRFDAAMSSQEPITFERFSEPLDIWETVRLYPSETGLSVYFTEITERKEYERELEEYRRWTQTLVDNFPNGAIALVDDDLRYVTFGGRLEGDIDLARVDLEGEPVRDALPDQVAEVVIPGYEAALDGEASEFEADIDGRVYQFHFVPVRGDDGDVFAATAMSQEVTERKERERLLREAKSQLEAATEAGAVGTWEWHVQEDRFVAGQSMAQTFGVDPEAVREGVSIDRYVSAIHEEDRERVERAVDEALADCGEYEQEYRVQDADGDLRWVVARGRVECDDEGEPVTFPAHSSTSRIASAPSKSSSVAANSSPP